MVRKSDPSRSPEYSSLEEYRKAFFPQSPEDTPVEATDPASFGARLAREVLKKALEASELPADESEKGKSENAG